MARISWILVVVIMLMACNKHVCRRNAVFDKNNYESAAYKRELIRQLQQENPDKIEYYAGDYTEQDNRQYLDVVMHSTRFCAVAKMDITDCDKLWHIKQLKGMTYHSAGLRDVTFLIDSSTGTTKFILKDIGKISD